GAGPRAHPRDPRRPRRRQEPVRLRAVPDGERQPDDQVHVPHDDSRPLPLAVLRAVRCRVDRRLRRADADDRLHGRLPQREGLMAAEPTAAPTTPSDSTNHGRRVVVAWIVLSAIATPLVAVFVGHLVSPGNGSTQGTEQVFDNTWMLSVVTPVICLLAVFFVYGLRSFHAADGAILDGPPLRNDSRIQILWIVGTSVTVLFLAGFGTYELLQNGAGGGQGPDPIAVPAGSKLQVQVIGQQWQFTYRYPALHGLESNQLV